MTWERSLHLSITIVNDINPQKYLRPARDIALQKLVSRVDEGDTTTPLMQSQELQVILYEILPNLMMLHAPQ